MGAGAHALLPCRRSRQQGVQDTRRLPQRGACAQLSLHPLQLRRAAGGQQRTNRRDRDLRHGRGLAAAAHLEPRRLDLDRAEQGLQPARAPVLGRLQHPACRTHPAVGRILRHLAAPHARLQLANSVLVPSSTRPISASVLTTAGQPNVTSSVVFTSPALVVISSRTVHCITPAALVLRHQPRRSARDRQAGCPRFLTLPACPQPHAGPGTPELRPHRLNANRVGADASTPPNNAAYAASSSWNCGTLRTDRAIGLSYDRKPASSVGYNIAFSNRKLAIATLPTGTAPSATPAFPGRRAVWQRRPQASSPA